MSSEKCGREISPPNSKLIPWARFLLSAAIITVSITTSWPGAYRCREMVGRSGALTSSSIIPSQLRRASHIVDESLMGIATYLCNTPDNHCLKKAIFYLLCEYTSDSYEGNHINTFDNCIYLE